MVERNELKKDLEVDGQKCSDLFFREELEGMQFKSPPFQFIIHTFLSWHVGYIFVAYLGPVVPGSLHPHPDHPHGPGPGRTPGHVGRGPPGQCFLHLFFSLESENPNNFGPSRFSQVCSHFPFL